VHTGAPPIPSVSTGQAGDPHLRSKGRDAVIIGVLLMLLMLLVIVAVIAAGWD